MIVVDASALVDVLRRSNGSRAIEDRLLDPRESLHAPHLIDLEVAQVLRRYVGRGDMGAHRGAQALDDLRSFPITRYEHEPFLPRIWSLRENLTAYDAAYVALAEGLDATLLTRDGRLAQAVDGLVSVEIM